MRPEDRKEFNTLLITAMAVYERQITAALGDLFFAALGQYSMDQVRDAMARHLQDPADGKFSPKPADLIRQIEGARSQDKRPGKDQAWSIALRSLDDNETVTVTPEILTALDTARPLLEMRDKVAARMAFVEVYEKLVASKRAAGVPMESTVSFGDDKSRRQIAIEDDMRRGMLTREQAEPYLLRIAQETQPITPEGLAIAGLLAAPEGSKPLTNEERQKRLQEVRSQIGKGARGVQAEKSHAEAMAERAETERLKNEVLGKINDLSADAGKEDTKKPRDIDPAAI